MIFPEADWEIARAHRYVFYALDDNRDPYITDERSVTNEVIAQKLLDNKDVPSDQQATGVKNFCSVPDSFIPVKFAGQQMNLCQQWQLIAKKNELAHKIVDLALEEANQDGGGFSEEEREKATSLSLKLWDY